MIVFFTKPICKQKINIKKLFKNIINKRKGASIDKHKKETRIFLLTMAAAKNSGLRSHQECGASNVINSGIKI